MSVYGSGWISTLHAFVVFSIDRRCLEVPGTYNPHVDCSVDIVTVKRVVADFDDAGGEALEAFHEVVDDVLEYAVKEPSNRFVCSLKLDAYRDYDGDYDQETSFDLTPIGGPVDPLAYASGADVKFLSAVASVAETRRVALAAGEAAIADLAAEILG